MSAAEGAGRPDEEVEEEEEALEPNDLEAVEEGNEEEDAVDEASARRLEGLAWPSDAEEAEAVGPDEAV